MSLKILFQSNTIHAYDELMAKLRQNSGSINLKKYIMYEAKMLSIVHFLPLGTHYSKLRGWRIIGVLTDSTPFFM